MLSDYMVVIFVLLVIPLLLGTAYLIGDTGDKRCINCEWLTVCPLMFGLSTIAPCAIEREGQRDQSSANKDSISLVEIYIDKKLKKLLTEVF